MPGTAEVFTHKWHGCCHALNNIFGRWQGIVAEQQLKDGLIEEVIHSLHSIENENDFVGETRVDVESLSSNFLRKETIVIAWILSIPRSV